MSEIWHRIIGLIEHKDVIISEHGYDELAADNIAVLDVIAGTGYAYVIEEYPEFPKGSCVLVLQYDNLGSAIHAVWGIPKGLSSPAVLITAYRPDPDKWTDDFKRRKS
jgi:hypothetical protein